MRHTQGAVTLIMAAIAALGPTASTAASAASAASAHPARIRVTATIPVGHLPFGVAASTRTDMIYVANFHSRTVSVISGRTNRVVATIPVAL